MDSIEKMLLDAGFNRWRCIDVVYFVLSRSREATAPEVKIGRTNDLFARWRSLLMYEFVGRQKPACRLLGTIECVDRAQSEEFEKRAHLWFNAERLHGEWFRPSVRLVAFCESLEYPIPLDEIYLGSERLSASGGSGPLRRALALARKGGRHWWPSRPDWSAYEADCMGLA